ncbi:MAG: DNA-binding IclR family transcriptional regulator [Gammaproteobacteria bacterium]|jgi:DNA-binding IclR family transcriptional regulator
MSETKVIHSVVTSLMIIEFMANADGPLGVSELAKSLETAKPRVHRHLRTLLNQGYVAQDPDNDKYYLTVKLFHIGQAIADQTGFLAEARRVMPALRDSVNLTVTIGQFEEEGIRILDILKHRSEFEISTRPGAFFDFHCSAQGKVALAFGPAHLWAKVEKGPLKAWTKKTNTDIEDLRKEVKLVRQRGWAVSPEEVLSGINALAAPIFGSAGTLMGTITILGSVQHLQRKPEAAQVAALVDAAAEVSARLGYREAIAV